MNRRRASPPSRSRTRAGKLRTRSGEGRIMHRLWKMPYARMLVVLGGANAPGLLPQNLKRTCSTLLFPRKRNPGFFTILLVSAAEKMSTKPYSCHNLCQNHSREVATPKHPRGSTPTHLSSASPVPASTTWNAPANASAPKPKRGTVPGTPASRASAERPRRAGRCSTACTVPSRTASTVRRMNTRRGGSRRRLLHWRLRRIWRGKIWLRLRVTCFLPVAIVRTAGARTVHKQIWMVICRQNLLLATFN
mmetsp:Transcript_7993/g.12849  ORF Transcript_7993/g.12849 Transcript_7993/m.12849 type:complete len:249 (+) Transcript_7993:1278-2024(+)